MLGIEVNMESKISEMNMRCQWSDLMQDDDKKCLEAGLYLTGLLSIVLGLWMNLSVLFSNLGLQPSYKNLLNFTMVACIRRIMPFIKKLSVVSLVSANDHTCCQFFAFLETFMAVYEVEALTHVCIERYVLVKYITNGWTMPKSHYILFQGLCTFFASLYSFPPLFGIGRYDFDFSCSSCTFDMMLQSTWWRYIVVAIFALRSIKPAIVMLAMLIWAITLENKLICSEETQTQKKFTKNMIIITILNELCWSPIALIRGCVILTQLVHSDMIVLDSSYIKWAIWIHWISPAVTAVALFLMDRQIRDNMLHLNSTNDTEEDKHK